MDHVTRFSIYSAVMSESVKPLTISKSLDFALTAFIYNKFIYPFYIIYLKYRPLTFELRGLISH